VMLRAPILYPRQLALPLRRLSLRNQRQPIINRKAQTPQSQSRVESRV
jgi:hypothetical protein